MSAIASRIEATFEVLTILGHSCEGVSAIRRVD